MGFSLFASSNVLKFVFSDGENLEMIDIFDLIQLQL